MTDDNHTYKFYGFAGTYWDAKAARENAAARQARDVERRSARLGNPEE